MGDLREEIKDGLLKEIKDAIKDEVKRQWAVSAFSDFVSALRTESEIITSTEP